MTLGHKRQKEYFRRVLEKGALAHAYLFYGPEAIGKFTFAREIAKTLICLEKKELGEECECKSCSQVEQNSHQFVTILDTTHTLVSKKEKRKEIPIEDIRELKRLFSLSAPGGQWRIAIINQAEKMNDEAANAFLKLLEEPGERTVFFLIASGKDILLPTVVSRAQGIGFSYVSLKDLSAYLTPRVRDTGKREEILMLSFGRPGEMIRLIKDEEYFEREKKFVKALETALTGGVPQIFKFTEKTAADEDSRFKAGFLAMRFLRQTLIANPDPALVSAIKRTHKVFMALESTNVNPRLALDVLLLEASIK